MNIKHTSNIGSQPFPLTLLNQIFIKLKLSNYGGQGLSLNGVRTLGGEEQGFCADSNSNLLLKSGTVGYGCKFFQKLRDVIHDDSSLKSNRRDE